MEKTSSVSWKHLSVHNKVVKASSNITIKYRYVSIILLYPARYNISFFCSFQDLRPYVVEYFIYGVEMEKARSLKVQ